MMTKKHRIFNWIFLSVLGLASTALFFPFIIEILLAAFFSFALAPLLRKLSATKYFRRQGWAGIVLACLVMLLIIPLIIVIYNGYLMVQDVSAKGFEKTAFFTDINNLRAVFVTSAAKVIDFLNLGDQIDLAAVSDTFLKNTSSKIIAISGQLASELPNIGLSLFVFSCSLYLFMAESRRIRMAFAQAKLVPLVELDQIIEIFQKSCSSTLVASVVVGLIQATIVAIGAAIFRTGDFMVVLVISYFLSFIPVVGTAPVALFLALLCLIKLQYSAVIGLIIVAVVAGTIDNIVRPFLVGSESDIHPVIVLLAIIGGIVIFGMPGLFLGPVIISVTFQVMNLYNTTNSASE